MTVTSSLFINGLALTVNLGWPDIERLHEQRVIVDLEIIFAKVPTAVNTDQLDDTVCYAELIKTLQNQTSGKNFHLIEHLAHTVYNAVKLLLGEKGRLKVNITKQPKIADFTGSVRFRYGDEL